MHKMMHDAQKRQGFITIAIMSFFGSGELKITQNNFLLTNSAQI